MILADRGFTVQESVGLLMGQLKIPAFTKGKTQLPALDVETTRALASPAIHVERLIGMVRQKYTMLQGTMPITLFQSDKKRSYCFGQNTPCCLCAMQFVRVGNLV